MRFRTVPDTNVVLSSQLSTNENSPNLEFFQRWERGEFDVLYSADTLNEYVIKLGDQGVPRQIIRQFVKQIRSGELVLIKHFHQFPDRYPIDPDDIAFILCADNGNASHLISYDKHLLDLASKHDFIICKTIKFLQMLRESQNLC